ncbi:MAG: hypothetical protein ACYTHJ_19835 [Planctomycetota bacterium]|jgi:hypothetical protein
MAKRAKTGLLFVALTFPSGGCVDLVTEGLRNGVSSGFSQIVSGLIVGVANAFVDQATGDAMMGNIAITIPEDSSLMPQSPATVEDVITTLPSG